MLSEDIANLHAVLRQMRNDAGELHLQPYQVGLVLSKLSEARISAQEMEDTVVAEDPCQVVISLDDFRPKKSRTSPDGGDAA